MIGSPLIILGSVVSLIGALGLIRFPDIYTRAHAQTVVNVGGTCLILVGVFLEAPFLSLYSAKSILLIIFIFLTSPVGTHAIARAAYKSGVKPRKIQEDELGCKIASLEKPEAGGKAESEGRRQGRLQAADAFKPGTEKPKSKKPKITPKEAIRKTKERIRKHFPRKDDW